MPRGGETKRYRDKKRAHYAVRAGTAIRRPSTDAEVVAMVAAIERPSGTTSLWGVRRLSSVDLNIPLPPLSGDVLQAALVAESRLDRASWVRWIESLGLADTGYDPKRHPSQTVRALHVSIYSIIMSLHTVRALKV
jgi:hypothetical protein